MDVFASPSDAVSLYLLSFFRSRYYSQPVASSHLSQHPSAMPARAAVPHEDVRISHALVMQTVGIHVALMAGALAVWRSELPGRWAMLAVLIVAREIDQQYEWSAHEPAGVRQGLEQSVIDVVKYDRPVTGLAEKDAFYAPHTEGGDAPKVGAYVEGIAAPEGCATATQARAYAELLLVARGAAMPGAATVPGRAPAPPCRASRT